MATDIGKVGIVSKGTWSNTATYEVLDAVTGSDGLYIAKLDVPAGTALSNTTYWMPALVTSNITNIASFNISGSGSHNVTFPSINGTLIIVGRSSVSVKGMYYIDNQNNVIELISSSAAITVSVSSGTVTVDNATGVAVCITIITKFSSIAPT